MKLPVPTQGVDLNPNCVFSKEETKLSMGECSESRQQVQPPHCLLGSSKEVGVTQIFIIPGQHHQQSYLSNRQRHLWLSSRKRSFIDGTFSVCLHVEGTL